MRHVGSDAERKRHHRQGGEERRLPERSYASPVAPRTRRPQKRSRVAMRFFRLLDGAERIVSCRHEWSHQSQRRATSGSTFVARRTGT
jgi:hypothetical protein